jgi:spore coat polysaccharide biosynthesis protein SpsF (cytidylyltransferase family)
MNCAIFLTTRIGSTRLPGKALLRINGETVTDILVKRLQKTGLPIIMTVPNTQDDIQKLGYIAERHGIALFPGEKDNVIKRHLDACKMLNIDYVILSEGDDWLVCSETINAVYHTAKELKFQKTIRTEGLPFGMNVIAYPRANLEQTDFSSDTGWGVHVTKDAHILKFNYDRPYILSMDTQKDFEVMENVFLNCKRNQFVGGIVGYLDKHPEIARMNMREENK